MTCHHHINLLIVLLYFIFMTLIFWNLLIFQKYIEISLRCISMHHNGLTTTSVYDYEWVSVWSFERRVLNWTEQYFLYWIHKQQDCDIKNQLLPIEINLFNFSISMFTPKRKKLWKKTLNYVSIQVTQEILQRKCQDI